MQARIVQDGQGGGQKTHTVKGKKKVGATGFLHSARWMGCSASYIKVDKTHLSNVLLPLPSSSRFSNHAKQVGHFIVRGPYTHVRELKAQIDAPFNLRCGARMTSFIEDSPSRDSAKGTQVRIL